VRSLDLSSSMPVLRDGVVNPGFVNRDATPFGFNVTGLY
jgi:hypothetical protein